MNFICTFGFFVVTLQPEVAKIKALLRKFWSTKEQMLREITEKYGFQILPLTPDVMYTYGKMNPYHNDPSDHVIIAQAITMKMPLVSDDNKFPPYRKEGLELIEN